MKVVIFGGTSEGRMLSECLCRNKIAHTLCVATDYGEEVLEPSEYAHVLQGRLDTQQMEDLIRREQCFVVVDATHPYAVEVSKNIRKACERTKMKYLRFLRDKESVIDVRSDVLVSSATEAAAYLDGQEGAIFLTTGSKELPAFTAGVHKTERLFVRVLPSAAVVASCRELGLEGKQICAMQGPFSEEMNRALLQQTKAAWLVTKDTGITGGFPEKVRAARSLGVRLVIIRRPEESGLDYKSVLQVLEAVLEQKIEGNSARILENSAEDRSAESAAGTEKISEDSKRVFEENEIENLRACSEENKLKGTQNVEPENKTEETKIAVSGTVSSEQKKCEVDNTQACSPEKRTISCIGIGMGTLDTLTHEAAETIRNADILFGAKRILESVEHMSGLLHESQERVEEYRSAQIAEYLSTRPHLTRIVILMSGDVGFYSGARLVQDAFPDEKIDYYCGISSVVYFASKVPTSWQDAKLLSAHGRSLNLLNCVQRYPKIIMIVSGVEDVRAICQELVEAEMTYVHVTVGTNLSYPEETVTSGTPEDFLQAETTGLHIMLLENPQANHIIVPGMSDETFVRGKVPMTKEEIRILSVAKLQLTEDSIVYDVGAGTGSVSMECARLCTNGTVYAVERNPEGIALIRENSKKLRLSNVKAIEGLAPEALMDLPAPTHAFIGGSAGNMGEILDVLRAKNPSVRIVINTIALESISEVMQLLKERGYDADIVQISAAKSRVLGRYHMMTGLNPVYIITIC
ncbi:MAG: precorrin-6A reductase [Lachnospiraceae bacterium]